jgi:hypothetical protein
MQECNQGPAHGSDPLYDFVELQPRLGGNLNSLVSREQLRYSGSEREGSTTVIVPVDILPDA